MHVISRKKLREFSVEHASATGPLDAWHTIAKHARWQSLADVRRHYPSADLVGKWVVFNIGGNHYRMITEINYQRQKIYIRRVLTHQEYDRGRWKQE